MFLPTRPRFSDIDFFFKFMPNTLQICKFTIHEILKLNFEEKKLVKSY